MSEPDCQPVPGPVEAWAGSLAELLESMTGERPGVGWRAVSGSGSDAGVGPEADVLWWEQGFQFPADASVWVGASRAAWTQTASLMMKAAGMEADPDKEDESRKTWQEILGQWLSMLARSISSLAGREVVCASGAEQAPPNDQREWTVVSVNFSDGTAAALAIAFSTALRRLLAAPPPAHPDAGAEPAGPVGTVRTPPTMDLLLDVELPVSISFGRTELPLKEVLKLTTGSIVELNRAVNEPVEILINRCLVARGEVVVVDGNYGVRVQRILSREERLKGLH